MRQLARTDPNWQALPADQRLLLAAQQAAADIKAEAARKVANAQRQALRTAEVETAIQAGQARQGWARPRAWVAHMEQTSNYIEGVKRDNTRHLIDLITAADSKQDASIGRQALMVLFDAQNPAMTRDLALEVFAQGRAGTGNAVAKAGAEAWLKVAEAMRQRFNAAGGDVGRLDYGYLPQAHDQARVLAKGRDAWAAEVLPLLDRKRYVKEDGARMSDAEVLDVLRGAWETISSDGANKTAPGQITGTGARANRGAESREIHFSDGDAYLEYLKKFGTGSMYDAMIGHIGGLSRDIGLVERYGPNPEAQARLQHDLAKRTGGSQRVFGNLPESYWSVLNGSSGVALSARVANIGTHVRNVETFAKLQGSVLSSVTDLGTYFATTGFNKLPYLDGLANIGKAMTKDTREFLDSHGMIAESMISDLNRWSGENVANAWSGKIAAATMRLSLMNAWTDTLRRAFSLTMMQGMGRLRSTAWGQLTEYDRWRMEAKGLTADDWAVIQQAQPVMHHGHEFVTPDAIYATGDPNAGAVVAKYLGLITDEAETAILNPDLATRVVTSGGGMQRGTMPGELMRAVMQFKSFPISMMSRHWRRAMDTPQGLDGAPVAANRLAYAGALMVSLTALGAVAFQTKQLIVGKDPIDMTTPKFWAKAMAQGGGLGFLGDVLLRDSTDDRAPSQGLFELIGPAAGSAAELYELTKGNFDEAAAGKDTHAVAEGVRFVRGHVPLMNLWYARAALDHAGLQAMQEAVSPGYLDRIENLAKKQWGQEYWWTPGEPLPDRAPDLAAIAGE